MVHTRDVTRRIRKSFRQAITILVLMSLWGRPSNALQDNSNSPIIHHFEFEVASIKLNASNSTVTNTRLGVDTFNATNVTPKTLLQLAYGLQSFQVIGGPKWLDTLHLDVHAKVRPEDVTAGVRLNASSLQGALQRLLAERFALKAHEEIREGKVLSLRVSNPKRLVIAAETEPYTILDTNTGLTATAATISQLAEQLSMELSRPVVDDTHLHGRYDLNIKLAEDSAAVASDQVEREAALIAALKADCGLVLKTASAPQQFLVVDQMELPSED